MNLSLSSLLVEKRNYVCLFQNMLFFWQICFGVFGINVTTFFTSAIEKAWSLLDHLVYSSSPTSNPFSLSLKNLPFYKVTNWYYLSFLAGTGCSRYVYVRKFKTWPGQKILAVSMQDTSAFAIRNSRVHEREGEPPEQEGTHQHSRLNSKEKGSKLKTKTHKI